MCFYFESAISGTDLFDEWSLTMLTMMEEQNLGSFFGFAKVKREVQ